MPFVRSGISPTFPPGYGLYNKLMTFIERVGIEIDDIHNYQLYCRQPNTQKVL